MNTKIDKRKLSCGSLNTFNRNIKPDQEFCKNGTVLTKVVSVNAGIISNRLKYLMGRFRCSQNMWERSVTGFGRIKDNCRRVKVSREMVMDIPGRIVVRCGSVIDNSGYVFVNCEGVADWCGGVVDECGGMLVLCGSVVDECGGVVEKCGRGINRCGGFVEEFGRIVDGYRMTGSGLRAQSAG